MTGHLFYIIVSLGSACSWAVGTILFKQISSLVSAVELTLAKSIFGLLFLGIGAALAGWGEVRISALVLLLFSGVIGIGLGDTLFFACLQRLSAHQVIVLVMLSPALTVFLAVIFLGEHPSFLCWIGFVLVLTGVTTTLWTSIREPFSRTISLGGIGCGLLAVLSMSVSTIIVKSALREVPALEGALVRMAAGSAGLLIFSWNRGSLVNGTRVLLRREVAPHFLIAVAVVTFGGFWLSLVAIKHLPVSIANILLVTEPLFALPIAVLWLGERPAWLAWGGSCDGLAGCFVVSLCGLRTADL